jgi:hypothetical protein
MQPLNSITALRAATAYLEVLYQLKLMDLKIEAMDSKFEAKFQTLFWAVGLIAAAIIAIATKLLFM